MNQDPETIIEVATVEDYDKREQIYELTEAANSAVLDEVLAFIEAIREARPDSFDAALLNLPSAADTIERGLQDYAEGRILPAGSLDILLADLREEAKQA